MISNFITTKISKLCSLEYWESLTKYLEAVCLSKATLDAAASIAEIIKQYINDRQLPEKHKKYSVLS